MRKIILGLVTIALVGLALRLCQLGSESLWLDEGFSEWAANRPISEVLAFVRSNDYNPPLYYMVLHYWIRMAGNSEWAMRLLSALCGILSLPLLYRVGRDLVGQTASIWATILVTVSAYHIYFSQEVRAYSLFGMLALISMYFFLRVVTHPTRGTQIGYLFFTILVLYVHPYGVFHVLAQNAMFVMAQSFRPERAISRFGWLGLQTLTGLAYVPWLRLTLRNARRVSEAGLIPHVLDIPGAIKAFVGDADFIADWAGEHFLIGGFFILLAIGSLLPKQRRNIGDKPPGIQRDFSEIPAHGGIAMTWAWLLVTLAAPYLVSILMVPLFSARYMVAGSFALFLLVGRGITVVSHRWVQFGVGAVALAASVYLLAPYYFRVNKEQWRQAAAHIESHAESDDVLIFHMGFCNQVVYRYYAARQDLVRRDFSLPLSGEVPLETIDRQLKSIMADHPRIWVILAHSRDRKGLFQSYLDGIGIPIQTRQFYRISVTLYERRREFPTSND